MAPPDISPNPLPTDRQEADPLPTDRQEAGPAPAVQPWAKELEPGVWALSELPPAAKPLPQIMAEQEAAKKWWESEVRADELAAQKAQEATLAYYAKYGVPAARVYHYTVIVPAGMGPGEDLACRGIPGALLERLPHTARHVFETPELAAELCAACISYMNVKMDEEGQIAAVFCGYCLTKLSRTPELVCACGEPRYLDAFAQPCGIVCSDCHQRHRSWVGERGGYAAKRKSRNVGKWGRRF